MFQVRSLSSAVPQAIVKVSFFLSVFNLLLDSVLHYFVFCLKPPVQVFGIEGRYATALYSAGSKQNQLEAIEKDLVKFQVSIHTN